MNKQLPFGISRLSLKFIGVAILAVFLSISIFSIFFWGRYQVFNVFHSKEKVEEKTNLDIDRFQSYVTQNHISKQDNKKIKKIMKKYKGYTMYLYDGNMEIDSEYFVSSLEPQAYLETSSFFVRIYDPTVQEFDVEFYDGKYTLFVYSYHGVSFMIRYLLFAIVITILIFILTIMVFIHRKMRYVLNLGEEMKSIELGDYHNTIIYKGSDEITLLAHQLNELRNALYMNMVREKDARKANEDLVTAMSHDLRTPLTSLLGYLDILHMKIYKNETERDNYIYKSKRKAEQIKDMSDRLFNHFLLYAQNEEAHCETLNQEDLHNDLCLFCAELIDRNYKIYDVYDKQLFQIQADRTLLDRIYGNLLSNIMKYAEKDLIMVSLTVNQGQAIMKFKNKKKNEKSNNESTKIGLKSMDKMMKEMGGHLHVEENHEVFSIELLFPCRKVLK